MIFGLGGLSAALQMIPISLIDSKVNMNWVQEPSNSIMLARYGPGTSARSLTTPEMQQDSCANGIFSRLSRFAIRADMICSLARSIHQSSPEATVVHPPLEILLFPSNEFGVEDDLRTVVLGEFHGRGAEEQSNCIPQHTFEQIEMRGANVRQKLFTENVVRGRTAPTPPDDEELSHVGLVRDYWLTSQ